MKYPYTKTEEHKDLLIRVLVIKTAKILATIYAMCEIRDINSYEFMIEYLNGSIKSIPLQGQKAIGAVATA